MVYAKLFFLCKPYIAQLLSTSIYLFQMGMSRINYAFKKTMLDLKKHCQLSRPDNFTQFSYLLLYSLDQLMAEWPNNEQLTK